MFESVAVPAPGVDGCVPDDGLPPDDGAWGFDVFDVFDDEAAWEALLAEAPPVEVPADPGRGFADGAPSGWSALDLDAGTGDAGVLSDAALIEAIVGFDRVGSWAAARQARLLAELAPSARRIRCRTPTGRVGGSVRARRGRGGAEAGPRDRGRAGRHGRAAARVLPATFALWQAGQIDTAKARAIHDATVVLTDELAATVEAKVLARAPEQSLPQLRAALARAIISVDPTGAAERHRAARTDRRVCVGRGRRDGARCGRCCPPPDAARAYEWLTRLARGLGRDDPRTTDARRADLVAELLTGRLVPTRTVDHNPDDEPRAPRPRPDRRPP